MNTVTYGTACAPYLALSCLERLAIEELERFLKAILTVEEMKMFLEIRLKIEELKKFLKEALDNEKSEFLQAILVLLEDFYMDDVLSGASTIEGAIALRQQLSELLQRRQFQLRKWRSNDPRILEELPESNDNNSFLKIDKEGAMKTLGLLWDAQSDVLQYSVSIEENSKVTKRLVLSQIAQIYDPLGLLGPVVIIAKCIMQSLWQIKTGWDEVLPTELEATWKEYYRSLPQTNEMKIPRNINPGNVSNQFDLVGFGDASEKAYGAVLYAVSQRSGGTLQAHLICSKSRVAPFKTISLPRLELDAALLLTKLTEQAKKAYGDRIRNVSLFSDSTVVLNWIAESPNIRKTYVANRITKIQLLSQGVTWRHVPSKDNPADLLSRGMSVEMWKTSQLWWQGPEWLVTDRWPEQPEILGDTSEMKITALIATRNEEYDILRRFSDYWKLQRIVAYCLRFKANLLGAKKSGPLTPAEIEQAETIILKTVQREVFLKEVRALEQQQSIPKGSKLSSLSPILDQEGVIRVGSRLSQADIPETQKHPILLPAKHHVTTILMRKEHLRLHHCGPEQLLYSTRVKYWPLSGRREANKITKSCIKCFRAKPRTPEVFMGDLPEDRVRHNMRPFTTAGVDYAGPLQVRESRRRGRIHISKAWIAVFTCFATKAVHIELVTELTTESFLAALRRFVARRGICSKIVSDNGTNFVGAARELAEVYEFLRKEKEAIATYLARQKIEWRFNPPRSPHFGGLWEAAVKATKRHLHTVTKGLVWTFEEYATLLVEIEAILNSRPLTPFSSDPNDLLALTPSHFLTGDSLLFPPEYSYMKVPDNKLSRWQHAQKLRQHFWKR
ncbi:uncharacterized protein LOC143898012 [Temnothorax americanus]|uniref:uncharacterized protein LOC143898012 n=1 Tax=Temnothorax americanus TaxID=1964332 RepID=UPI0040691F79